MSQDKEIVIKSVFQSARTTVDGAWRISFDAALDESDNIKKIVELSGCSFLLVVLPQKQPSKTKDDPLDFDLSFDEIP